MQFVVFCMSNMLMVLESQKGVNYFTKMLLRALFYKTVLKRENEYVVAHCLSLASCFR